MTISGQRSSQATKSQIQEGNRRQALAARSNKGKATVDLWLKEIAPSTQLREWFGHDPDRWKSFR